MNVLNVAKVFVKNHKVQIGLTVGVVSFGCAIVEAYKASAKSSDILKETKLKVDSLKEEEKNRKQDIINNDLSAEEEETSLAVARKETKQEIVKTYAKSTVALVRANLAVAGFSALSLGCFVGLSKSLNKDVLALNSALIASNKLTDSYKAAYEGVVDRFRKAIGTNDANPLIYGTKQEDIKTETVNKDTGEVAEKEVKNANVFPSPENVITNSPFAAFFDESSEYYTGDPDLDTRFLCQMQEHWNTELKTRNGKFSPIEVNEIYRSLGLKETDYGHNWAFTYDDKKGDVQIDFHIYSGYRQAIREYQQGYKPVFLLDFEPNCRIANGTYAMSV